MRRGTCPWGQGRWRGATAGLAALVGLTALACKPKVRDLPVCPEMVAAGKATEAESQTLPIDVWFSVLVRGFERTAMEAPDDARECSGKAIEVTWPPALQEDPRAAARRQDRRRLGEADISFSQAGEGEMLVWARIVDLSNGDALGPVALVRWVPRGLEVRGIGSVQAPAQRVRMRLEPLGEDDQVLVLESEFCPEDAKADACSREAQLLPLVEQRFLSAPLIEAGVDVGPARFPLSGRFEEPLKDGWVRRYELQRKLAFEGGVAFVDENIRTKDCDPKSAATPCEERIAASEKRPLVFQDGAFQTGSSPWKQVSARQVK